MKKKIEKKRTKNNQIQTILAIYAMKDLLKDFKPNLSLLNEIIRATASVIISVNTIP